MNKIIKKLLVAALAISATAGADGGKTNKTFFAPRPQGVNLPMEFTTMYHMINHVKKDDNFGGHLQVGWFYTASTNDEDLGKYFGIRNQNKVGLRYGNSEFTKYSDVKNHFDLGYMIHDPVAAAAGSTKTQAAVSLAPEQVTYGFRFDYYQDLSKILDGLYLKASLPIVYVKNDMHLKRSGCDSSTTLADTVEKYLTGEYEETTATSPKLQSKLTKHKIKCGGDSRTTVADIDVIVGYNFVQDECYHAGINLGLVIPTGDEPDGEWAFAPIVGNNNHFGFGFGLDGDVKLWGDDEQHLNLTAMMNYRFLFENCEQRTLSLKDTCDNDCSVAMDCADCSFTSCTKTNCDSDSSTSSDCGCDDRAITINTKKTKNGAVTKDCGTGSCSTDKCDDKSKSSCCSRNWGHYTNIGTVGKTGVTPMANISTMKVDVTPGSQIDAILALSYHWSGVTLDLGYNLFYKDEEDVKSKCGPTKDTYYVARRNYAANVAFVAADHAEKDAAGKEIVVDATTLNPASAATPSQLTHKVFAGVGYSFEDWDTPLTLGAGGSYEFAGRGALEGWALWVKLGVSF